MTRAVLLLALAPGAALAQHAGDHHAPYAGLQDRPVAALSEAEVRDLAAGRGMGYALSAELNGHPGPLHVVELRAELGLDDEQVAAVTAIRDRMTSEARERGVALLAAERRIDAAFEAGGLDAAKLADLVAEAARVEAELRTVHLAAHLEVTPLLTAEQVATYARLRGYDSPAAPHPHEP